MLSSTISAYITFVQELCFSPCYPRINTGLLDQMQELFAETT